MLDLVDVDCAKFEAYARDERWPRTVLYAREGKLLARAEADMAGRADVTLLVSEEEAELFRTALRDRARRARAVERHRRGVLQSGQRLAASPSWRAAARTSCSPDRWTTRPNVAAAKRVVEKAAAGDPPESIPKRRFHIVGRAPVPALTKLDGKDGVRVWGEVPDVRPFLAGATIVVVPLEIARGVQNKVLEAMAMARPVVATSGAATGLGAENDRQLIVTDRDRGLIAEALTLLCAIPSAAWCSAMTAREFVLEHKSWQAMLAPLPELIAGIGSNGRARDAA